MADNSTPIGASAPPLSLISRFIGVITAPRATFESIVAHPKWLGMLALTTLLVTAGTTLPMTTEAGREALLDKQVQQMESFGVTVTDEMFQQMRGRIGSAPYTTAAGIIIASPIIVAIFAGIVFGIFAAMGGSATYKQVYTVLVHAGVISSLGPIFTGPLNYLRGSMASATNLSVLLPMIPETSFVGRIAGMVDLFLIWWVLVLATGIAVLYRRRTQPVAMSLFAVYALIAVTAAGVMSYLGGSK
jgi:hypothetical protein